MRSALIIAAFFLNTVSLAQNVCVTGVVGKLAPYAQYDAIQINCSRTYPQYNRGTTTTSTQTVTSGTTTTTSTRTVAGVRVTSSASPIISTVRTITAAASLSTTTTTRVVPAATPASTTSTATINAPTSTVTVSTTVRTVSTITITATTVTVYSTTITVVTTVTAHAKMARNEQPRARGFRVRRADATPALKLKAGLVKRSKEEEFQASLKSQGASSSALFRTFCSCYETIGYSATTRVTVQQITTATTTTTTLPTTVVTSTAFITFTTTTTPVTTVTSTSTSTSTTTIVTTTTSTPTATTTSTAITTDIVSETPTLTTATTTTSTTTAPAAFCTDDSIFYINGHECDCRTESAGGADPVVFHVADIQGCGDVCAGFGGPNFNFYGDRDINCVCYNSFSQSTDPYWSLVGHAGWAGCI